MKIQFITQIWREENTFVAYIPQLDLSSCGKTQKEAKKNLVSAMEAFLETAKEMGTLEQILEESGFTYRKKWEAPELVSSERQELVF